MPFRTDTKTLVMAALLDGPRHGYAIAKSLHEGLEGHHRIAGGQVYVALRGLEIEGWVEAEWSDEGAERRVYRLTEAGCRELDWRTAEWHRCADAIARMLPRPDRISLV